MTMSNAYPRLMEAVNEVRAQWRRQKLLEGVLLAAAGVTAVLVLLVAADNLLQPGKAVRVLLAAVLWGSLIGGLFSLVVRRWLEDQRDDFFAALVEQKHPELRNQLINALQLGRARQSGFSAHLVTAIVNDADCATQDMELADSVDTRPVRRAAGWALLALVGLGGYAAAMTPRFTNGLARLLLPVSDVPPYTRTQVLAADVHPGSTRIAEGKSLAITARVRGEVPPQARLHLKTAQASWQERDMSSEAGHDDVFRYELSQVAESFEYFITAGDGRSPTFHVESVQPPRIERLSVTTTPPSYTELPAQTAADSDGEISGLPGTTVKLEMRASKALHKVSLITREGDVIALQPGADEQTWTASFVLWTREARRSAGINGRLLIAPTTYHLRLLDTDGYENADPLWRVITATRDGSPTVELAASDDRQPIHPGTTLTLTAEARDDYGLAEVNLVYRVNGEEEVRKLAHFPHDGKLELKTSDSYCWSVSAGGLKVGDSVEYWAEAADRNTLTGPGKGASRHLSFKVERPADVAARLDLNVIDYVRELATLLRLQRENRVETAESKPWDGLVKRQGDIRQRTRGLARTMERDGVPLETLVPSLDALAIGPMAEVLKLLESGRDAGQEELAGKLRQQSLPVQDRIIAELQALLERLQRNEETKRVLRKIEKKDPATHKQLEKVLNKMVRDLDKLVDDRTQEAGKFERLPKKADAIKEELFKDLNKLEDIAKRGKEKWAKGSVNELTKLGEGFVDDFGLRKDVNRIFEEIEKAEKRNKSEKAEVSLEDLGAGLATKMKEDLEMWMPDSPDNIKWVQEEPLNKKPMKIPEMPLPSKLEDMIGDLLQKADEFDQDADDVTSAWADNLDQAGWGVSDGPISTFSAKGKTGNDQPNNMELTGRSGDGRRGKSTGQMVGDTSRALPGRKTPARVGAEKYEPGQLKQEGQEDPNGATGGGKKAGAGRKGLQGGTPPDMVRNIGRLSAKQAGLREKAEQVARKLDTLGITSSRLKQSIDTMKSVEKDLADHRYEDAFRKRRDAVEQLRSAVTGVDRSTAARIHRARDLPPELRKEMLQSADEGYPAGYEGLLKSYYKALSTAEK
jgi:hypothetical protein